MINHNLPSDLTGKMFRKTINCEDTWDPFVTFWKNNLE